jgi:hypothetical protein
MAQRLSRVKIHVEGKNDQYSLINLLIRHGIDYDHKPWPATYPEFDAAISDSGDSSRHADGVEALLTSIREEVKIQAGGVVGFVLDADESPADRWIAIRERLAASSVTTLDDPAVPVEQLPVMPGEGFIGISQEYQTRVGVWLMPNSQDPGALETFLATLVPKSNEGFPAPLYEFAQACTKAAKSHHGAGYRDVDRLKADLACWLAWQENPGRPYGTAIRARYLQHDSPVALQFVTWFKTLFQIT